MKFSEFFKFSTDHQTHFHFLRTIKKENSTTFEVKEETPTKEFFPQREIFRIFFEDFVFPFEMFLSSVQ